MAISLVVVDSPPFPPPRTLYGSTGIRMQHRQVVMHREQLLVTCLAAVFASVGGYGAESSPVTSQEPGLVGYWKLQGDCRDYSGHGNHGVNHGVNLDSSAFDGIVAYVEVPSSASLKLGTGNFSLCAWFYTEKELDDVVGDVLDLYDPSLRRGITLSVNSSGSGYQGQGSDRHVCFGIDNARATEWQDCGRPSRTSP